MLLGFTFFTCSNVYWAVGYYKWRSWRLIFELRMFFLSIASSVPTSHLVLNYKIVLRKSSNWRAWKDWWFLRQEALGNISVDNRYIKREGTLNSRVQWSTEESFFTCSSLERREKPKLRIPNPCSDSKCLKVWNASCFQKNRRRIKWKCVI